LRSIDRPAYDTVVQDQITTAKTTTDQTPEQQLAGLLASGDTWTIS
ncbi:2-oxoacid:ferredoxin oxidoreductase subunit beta, partial [Micromonospora sp. PPF5-17]